MQLNNEQRWSFLFAVANNHQPFPHCSSPYDIFIYILLYQNRIINKRLGLNKNEAEKNKNKNKRNEKQIKIASHNFYVHMNIHSESFGALIRILYHEKSLLYVFSNRASELRLRILSGKDKSYYSSE